MQPPKFSFQLTSILFIFTFILCLLLLPYSYFRYFDHDELEHIHSAWYISTGALPYKDFYQHHQPLFWYNLIPSIYLRQYSSFVLIAGRILMYVYLLGIIGVTYLLAKCLTKSSNIGLISIILLASNQIFFDKALEIRPDVPQVFFGLLSFYLFIKYLQSKNVRSLIATSLTAALSFLFLQKSIFYLFILGLLILFSVFTKKISWKDVWIFIGIFLLPISFFILYLAMANIHLDYFLTNWLMNASKNDGFSPSWIVLTKYGLFLFVPMIISAFYLLIKKDVSQEVKFTVLMALAMFCVIFTIPYPYLQYFLFCLPLFYISLVIAGSKVITTYKIFTTNLFLYVYPIGLTVVILYGYKNYPYIIFYCIIIVLLTYIMMILSNNAKCRQQFFLFCLLLLAIIPGLVRAVSNLTSRTNLQARKLIDFAINNSKPSDYFYDGNINYNLFRKDLYYFWYSVDKNKGMDTYNKLTNNKRGDYNLCYLIKLKKPKFVSDFNLNLNKCGIADKYQLIVNRGEYLDAIYMRKE